MSRPGCGGGERTEEGGDDQTEAGGQQTEGGVREPSEVRSETPPDLQIWRDHQLKHFRITNIIMKHSGSDPWTGEVGKTCLTKQRS